MTCTELRIGHPMQRFRRNSHDTIKFADGRLVMRAVRLTGSVLSAGFC